MKLMENSTWALSILRNIGDAIITTDQLRTITYLNPAAEALTGWKSNNAVGKSLKTVFRAINEQTCKTDKNPLIKVLQEDKIISLAKDIILISKDGKEIPIDGSIAPIKDDTGNITGIVLLFREVIERRRAEIALREREEKLRLFIESAPDSFALLDSKLNYIEINKIGLKAFGKPKEEIIGKNILDFSPEIKETGRYKKYLEVLRTGKPFNVDYIHSHPIFGDVFFNVRAFRVDKGLGLIITDITERERAEQKIRESEEQFRTIAEQSFMGIVIIQDGILKYLNKTIEKMMEVNIEEVLGQPVLELFQYVHPEDHSRAKRNLQDKEGGKPTDVEHFYKLITKSGKMKWIDNYAKPIIYQGRNALLATIIDITDKMETKTQLRESKELYRELANSITDVFFAMDKNLKAIYWNKASEKLTGISAKDIIGKSIFEIFPDNQNTNSVVNVYQEVLKTRQSQSLIQEYQLRGMKYFFEISIYPSKEGLSVFVKDITDRKRVEKALQKSETRFRQLFNVMAEGIVLISSEGQIIQTNPAAERILGLRRSEIENRTNFSPKWKLLRPDGTAIPPEENPAYLVMKEKPIVKDYTVGVKRPDGIVSWINVNAAPIIGRDGNLEAYVTTFADVTKRKFTEEKLKDSEEKYRKAYDRANFYKDLFAHDINNILQAILGAKDMCSCYIQNSETLKDAEKVLAAIEEHVIRGANLVSNVLKLFNLKKIDVSLKSINILEVLNQTIKNVKEGFPERQVDIQVDFSNNKFFTMANELLIDLF
ncbi:MAG: PAS domain S-box protein, partial [Promethearchaeota archaeon]